MSSAGARPRVDDIAWPWSAGLRQQSPSATTGCNLGKHALCNRRISTHQRRLSGASVGHGGRPAAARAWGCKGIPRPRSRASP